MQQAFPAAFMEKTLDPINHQAVLVQQFRGTHGRPNRHFIQTLHRLYGGGFVRHNFRQIYAQVVSAPIDRPANPDAILALTFPSLHRNLTFDQLDDLTFRRYFRGGSTRAIYSNLVRNPGAGLPPMLVSYYSVSPGPVEYATLRQDASHLFTDDDFRWIHDQILQHDGNVYSEEFWRSNPVPSACRPQ